MFLGGWQGNAVGGVPCGPGGPGPYVNRTQYPPQPSPQQWNSGQRPPGPPGPGGQPPGPGQWDQHRYPPQGQQQSQYPPNQQVCSFISKPYYRIN